MDCRYENFEKKGRKIHNFWATAKFFLHIFGVAQNFWFNGGAFIPPPLWPGLFILTFCKKYIWKTKWAPNRKINHNSLNFQVRYFRFCMIVHSDPCQLLVRKKSHNTSKKTKTEKKMHLLASYEYFILIKTLLLERLAVSKL